ncbi:uncharacterized protein SAPINGB_P001038 [Magnusiomyces paraingens]|uniref:Uncharacterized protein n=1 Tax=Magnusiomyces paraingens TaxID=2606893 RepID=A0A5E8B5J7_9ASCO|nr:uncharacterized protein SAPINGB_P001038 [Saprochaete ingens]VVT46084.1 unnamed protein product [Saprochaete ingens]
MNPLHLSALDDFDSSLSEGLPLTPKQRQVYRLAKKYFVSTQGPGSLEEYGSLTALNSPKHQKALQAYHGNVGDGVYKNTSAIDNALRYAKTSIFYKPMVEDEKNDMNSMMLPEESSQSNNSLSKRNSAATFIQWKRDTSNNSLEEFPAVFEKSSSLVVERLPSSAMKTSSNNTSWKTQRSSSPPLIITKRLLASDEFECTDPNCSCRQGTIDSGILESFRNRTQVPTEREIDLPSPISTDSFNFSALCSSIGSSADYSDGYFCDIDLFSPCADLSLGECIKKSNDDETCKEHSASPVEFNKGYKSEGRHDGLRRRVSMKLKRYCQVAIPAQKLTRRLSMRANGGGS